MVIRFMLLCFELVRLETNERLDVSRTGRGAWRVSGTKEGGRTMTSSRRRGLGAVFGASCKMREEKMIATLRNLCAAGVTCVALGLPTEAFAASLGVVLTEEGFPPCNRFAINGDITQLQRNNPGSSFSLTGPGGR
jgi:hypothetical protein